MISQTIVQILMLPMALINTPIGQLIFFILFMIALTTLGMSWGRIRSGKASAFTKSYNSILAKTLLFVVLPWLAISAVLSI